MTDELLLCGDALIIELRSCLKKDADAHGEKKRADRPEEHLRAGNLKRGVEIRAAGD